MTAAATIDRESASALPEPAQQNEAASIISGLACGLEQHEAALDMIHDSLSPGNLARMYRVPPGLSAHLYNSFLLIKILRRDLAQLARAADEAESIILKGTAE